MNPMVPDALSHRQLQDYFQAAVPDAFRDVEPAGCDQDLKPELKRWADASEALLQKISTTADHIGKYRSAQQMMALGSFRAYLKLSLQALKAAEA